MDPHGALGAVCVDWPLVIPLFRNAVEAAIGCGPDGGGNQ